MHRAAGPVLDQHLDVALLITGLDHEGLRGPVQVAFAVRRVLQELPEPGEVALRRGDVAVGLDRVEPTGLARPPPVGGGPRHDDVVTGPVGQRPEHGLHDPGAGLDVDALVADRVAVVGRLPGVRDDVADPDVVVAEHEPPTGDRVRGDAILEEPVQLQVPRLERVVGGAGLVGQLPYLAVDDRRRNAAVVEQRGVRGEALLPHQLLAVEVALGVAVLGVPLGRDGTDAAVVSHESSRCPFIGRFRPIFASSLE